MSERTKNLPRRSCLSIPGSSEKMLGKGPSLGADMVFLDLEDSVSPLEKVAARAKVVNAITSQDWGETVLCVRVNAWDTEWTVYDILEVVDATVRVAGHRSWIGEVNAEEGRRRRALDRVVGTVLDERPNLTASRLTKRTIVRYTVRRSLPA